MPRQTRSVEYSTLMAELRAHADPQSVAGMARFGINPSNTLGVSMPLIRSLAKGVHDHALALQLWESGVHEARILAALVDVAANVDTGQMDHWAAEFDSWDVCDQVCFNLFDRTHFAVAKAIEWSARPEEFVKRAAFTLMAGLAIHAKKAPDELFLQFLPIIRREAGDGRNFVKKAVNWALRGIGKRSPALREPALALARELSASSAAPARWIGKDAARELESRG